MVVVKDFRKGFYDVIQNQRLLVLVAFDVDALAACRIVQYLFRCDHVLYTIVPVGGLADLEKGFVENSDGVKYVLMINCGACMDVVETFQPEDHVVFYICDSHRPVDIHNVFNQEQVQLLMKQGELEDVPVFDSLFREDDSEDDSGNESEGSEPSNKRRRFTEDAIIKRREKRNWEETRKKVLFEYTEFTGHGTSSAFLMYEMAWKMSKDTNDLLWLAIVGVTEQHMNKRIERDKYIEDVGQLQSHVSRLNHRVNEDDEENKVSVDCLKITFDRELQLVLYRHWSLYESLCHSEYLACKFRVWTMKGKKRLQEFLADMGLPLVQCHQKFSSMDMSFRDSFKEVMSKYTEKYSLTEQDLFLPSFHAQFGYKNKFCATDVVKACEAMLENTEKELSSDNFLQALDVLNRLRPAQLEKSMNLAKIQQKTLVTQVQAALDMNQVICAGPFLYSVIQEGTPDAKIFAKPLCLGQLARFTLQAYCSMSKLKKARNLPLVLAAPLNADLGTMLVIGIPPISDNTQRNCLGKAFEQAATPSGARTVHDCFDTHVIELKTEDKGRFFDSLTSLLQ